MLTAGELAAMRGTLDASLPDSGTIARKTWTSDGEGGGSITYPVAGTAACRVSPISQSGMEALLAGKLTTTTQHVITFAAGTDVQTTDQIASGGETYEVVAVVAPRTWEISRRVYAVRVE
jgi:hypothetical protein